MTYPELLKRLISFIPADVCADKEKEITEIADAIAKDRARLKKEMLENWLVANAYDSYQRTSCIHCGAYFETYRGHHAPDCIVRQLQEEKE